LLPRLLKRYGIAIAWGIGILVLTGIPGQKIPRIPEFLLAPDMIVHFLVFFGFAFHLMRGFNGEEGWSYKKIVVLSLISALSLGAITEILQWSVFINRTGSMVDFLVDLLGSVAGLFTFSLWKGFFQENRNNK
jgi:VanZ family protein